jgi:hypothetical protein
VDAHGTREEIAQGCGSFISRSDSLFPQCGSNNGTVLRPKDQNERGVFELQVARAKLDRLIQLTLGNRT